MTVQPKGLNLPQPYSIQDVPTKSYLNELIRAIEAYDRNQQTETPYSSTDLTPATFVHFSGSVVHDSSTFDGYTIGQVVTALKKLGILV